MPELTRALRALSSCYVEPLTLRLGAGPRQRRQSARRLRSSTRRCTSSPSIGSRASCCAQDDEQASEGSRASRITLDLGCGTGAAGAAWALATGAGRVEGYDINPWAAREARWSYDAMGLQGSTHRVPIDPGPLAEGAGRHDCGVRPATSSLTRRARPSGQRCSRPLRWTSGVDRRTDRQRRGPLVDRLAAGNAGRRRTRRRVALQGGIARNFSDAWTGPPASITGS